MHDWDIKTAYYNAKVPIWIDEIPEIDAWKTEFLKPEAKEVVEAIGAWVYCFKNTSHDALVSELERTLEAIQEISEVHVGDGADTVMLAVAMPSKTVGSTDRVKQEELEDVCIQYGFEYIDYSAKWTNEFGEKTGLERLREALEANEWTDTTFPDGNDDGFSLEFDADENEEDDLTGLGRDEVEMTAELFGMKAALAGSDFEPDAEDFVPPDNQDGQVEDLYRLMGKLLAVKEQSADLPEAQRKRMAAKAVRELMKDSPDI